MPLAQWHTGARIQTCLQLLQKIVSPRSRNCAWTGDLRGVIADLEELNRTTEADFLAIGGNLMAFLTASRQLHSEIDGLTAVVSGEQVQHACDELVSVRRYIEEVQDSAANGSRALLTLHTSAARIHRGFSTLDQIAKSFRITAILARIETAHLTASRQDLENLADEVGTCSAGIQSSASQVLEAAATFSARIAGTLAELSNFAAIQQKELPSLLAAVDADLQTFEARQRDAVSVSSKLTADLHSVAKDLGAIATSIQFHDITRQQVEHLIEALTKLVGDMPKRALSPAAASLVKVQKAQLESAAAAFRQSTRSIDNDLEGIAAKVEKMAAASRSLLGLDQPQNGSVLGDMQGRMAAVLKNVRESASLEDAARTIIADVDALSKRLHTSVKEVQIIELQLSRTSINGIIAACRIGIQGEPLSVVAGAMQALQLECAARSLEANADLDSISEVIASLAAGAKSDVSTVALLGDLKTRMSDLGLASASSAEASRTVATLADALCKELAKARAHSGIGRSFTETADRCCAVLEGVAAQAEPVWSFGAPVAETALEDRYTMQSERDIHLALVNGAAPVGLEEAVAQQENEVEFF